MLQTPLGKALAVVLGNTTEVKKLDKKRSQLKRAINRNYDEVKCENRYKDIPPPIQVKVLAENSKT